MQWKRHMRNRVIGRAGYQTSRPIMGVTMSKIVRVIIIIMIELCPSVLLAQTWSNPERVSPYMTSYYLIRGKHGLTTNSSGMPWCGWSAETHNPLAWNMYVSYYGATSWSIPDTIYPFGGFENCDLATDANGNIWVVAEDLGISACFYDGISWSNLMQVPVASCSHYPVAAGDSLGKMYVCWAGGGPSDYHHIWGNAYINGQWGSPVLISNPGSYEEYPYSMTTDKQGKVWVGWYRFFTDCAICVSHNDGSGWSTPMIIAEYSSTHRGPALTVDTAGNVWAGWVGSEGISVCYYDGNIWSEPISVSGSAPGDWPIDIAIDNQNIVWLTWNNPPVHIYYSYWNGSNWSAPAPVDTYPASDLWPKMTFDGERIWVAWYSERDGSPGIFASYTYGLDVEENPALNPKPLPVLYQNCPNPFSGRTQIRFQILDEAGSSQKSVVSIKIFDAAGRSVKSFNQLTNNQSLVNQVTWDGKDDIGEELPSGAYFYRLDVGDFTETKKMLLIH